VLVDVLARDYPLDNELIIYRATTLPIQQARIERVLLGDLPQAQVGMADTVVIAPARPLQADLAIRARLADLDAAMEGTI
jgi:hypothetical protein